jgi:hypothetical protein
MDFLRFLWFTLRPTARSPEVFDWPDILRAVSAFTGIGLLGFLGRWLDASIETAEANGMTPDWFFTIVFLLVGFAGLSLFAGTRLTTKLRKISEPVLEIDQNIYRRGDAISGESFGSNIRNTQDATAINCQGQITEMQLFHPSQGISVSNWPIGNLQWSPQSRIDVKQEAVTDIRGSLVASLDVVHYRISGFERSEFSSSGHSSQFLFAYANDKPLMSSNPPPSSLQVLMLITVKGDNSPSIYAVCLFNPTPKTDIRLGPPDDEGNRKISGNVEPFLKLMTVTKKKPCLANFQQSIPDIPDVQN